MSLVRLNKTGYDVPNSDCGHRSTLPCPPPRRRLVGFPLALLLSVGLWALLAALALLAYWIVGL